MHISKKYILCRPEGGLNDIFCRIWFCINYSINYDRIVLIDTLNTSFHESFDKYFIPLNNFVRIVDNSTLQDLFVSHLSIFPSIPEKLSRYKWKYIPSKNYCSFDSEISLQFNSDVNYDEDVLLYHACGGGGEAIKSLFFFRLSDYSKNIVFNAYKNLPDDYVAIHIRSTDMQIPYIEYLEKIKSELRGKNVYIATDSLAALDFIKKTMPDIHIYNFSNSLSINGNPLHMYSETDTSTWNRSQINMDAIKDLFILAKSKKLYIPNDKNGNFSGFSILAHSLHINEHVLNQLLN